MQQCSINNAGDRKGFSEYDIGSTAINLTRQYNLCPLVPTATGAKDSSVTVTSEQHYATKWQYFGQELNRVIPSSGNIPLVELSKLQFLEWSWWTIKFASPFVLQQLRWQIKRRQQCSAAPGYPPFRSISSILWFAFDVAVAHKIFTDIPLTIQYYWRWFCISHKLLSGWMFSIIASDSSSFTRCSFFYRPRVQCTYCNFFSSCLVTTRPLMDSVEGKSIWESRIII